MFAYAQKGLLLHLVLFLMASSMLWWRRKAAALGANTIPCLLTHSLRNSSPQKSKKDLDMLRLVPAGDPSFTILQGWQEDKWEALLGELTLFPVGLSPF